MKYFIGVALVLKSLINHAVAAVQSIELIQILAQPQMNGTSRGHESTDGQQPMLTDDIPLHLRHSISYYADISINAKKESHFKMIIDTSFNTILLSQGYEYGRPEETSHSTVEVGNTVIKKQEFTTSYTGTIGGVHGLFGLGYANGSPLYNMINQGLLDESVFSVYLREKPALLLGGVDEKYYKGDITCLPTAGENSWEVHLNSISIDGQTADTPYTTAVFDTGSAGLFLPSALADLLNRRIGTRSDYSIDCDKRDTLPDLMFKLLGHEFAITAWEYVLEVPGEGCATSIFADDEMLPDGNAAVVLGVPFLKRWYSVYDVEKSRIGLARAL